MTDLLDLQDKLRSDNPEPQKGSAQATLLRLQRNSQVSSIDSQGSMETGSIVGGTNWRQTQTQEQCWCGEASPWVSENQ